MADAAFSCSLPFKRAGDAFVAMLPIGFLTCRLTWLVKALCYFSMWVVWQGLGHHKGRMQLAVWGSRRAEFLGNDWFSGGIKTWVKISGKEYNSSTYNPGWTVKTHFQQWTVLSAELPISGNHLHWWVTECLEGEKESSHVSSWRRSWITQWCFCGSSQLCWEKNKKTWLK